MGLAVGRRWQSAAEAPEWPGIPPHPPRPRGGATGQRPCRPAAHPGPPGRGGRPARLRARRTAAGSRRNALSAAAASAQGMRRSATERIRGGRAICLLALPGRSEPPTGAVAQLHRHSPAAHTTSGVRPRQVMDTPTNTPPPPGGTTRRRPRPPLLSHAPRPAPLAWRDEGVSMTK